MVGDDSFVVVVKPGDCQCSCGCKGKMPRPWGLPFCTACWEDRSGEHYCDVTFRSTDTPEDRQRKTLNRRAHE